MGIRVFRAEGLGLRFRIFSPEGSYIGMFIGRRVSGLGVLALRGPEVYRSLGV